MTRAIKLAAVVGRLREWRQPSAGTRPLSDEPLLVVGEGMTHAEAATALGVSESTISGRMHEVRRQAGHAKDIGDE